MNDTQFAIAFAIAILPSQIVQGDVSKEFSTMKVTSSAFQDKQSIPGKYTCDGVNVSPPLHFSDVPANVKTLVLIVDDPDAPSGTFDHWIVWNLSPNEPNLPEGAKPANQGTNHYNKQQYNGPCPPKGPVHRYFFKLYALDVSLALPKGASKEEVEEAMEGHIVAKAELVGTYKR